MPIATPERHTRRCRSIRTTDCPGSKIDLGSSSQGGRANGIVHDNSAGASGSGEAEGGEGSDVSPPYGVVGGLTVEGSGSRLGELRFSMCPPFAPIQCCRYCRQSGCLQRMRGWPANPGAPFGKDPDWSIGLRRQSCYPRCAHSNWDGPGQRFSTCLPVGRPEPGNLYPAPAGRQHRGWTASRVEP